MVRRVWSLVFGLWPLFDFLFHRAVREDRSTTESRLVGKATDVNSVAIQHFILIGRFAPVL